MNVEAYDLDLLRRLVRSLQDENRRLKELLDKADNAYESENVFDEKIESIEEYDSDQGGRIQNKYITEELANKYFAMFWGRMDVSAKRGTKGGYLQSLVRELAKLPSEAGWVWFQCNNYRSTVIAAA